MSDEALMTFLQASTAERIRLAASNEFRPTLRATFGELALEIYDRLHKELDTAGHLGGSSPPNLVFVPGIMGSLLTSESLGGVWWIDARTRHHLDHLALAPDGAHDLNPDYKIAPFQVDISYEGFLAGALATPDFGHVSCAYDWRKTFASNTSRVRDSVTNAARQNGGKPVHIVAHSMGGLLVRETLRSHPDVWDHVGRIVFIGTPHYGSPSIAGYLKNHLGGFNLMAVLGRYLTAPTFRSLWGALSLLPAPKGIYPDTRPTDTQSSFDYLSTDEHPCANFDMYDAEVWNLDLSKMELAQLQQKLDHVALFHRQLHAWHMSLDQEQRERMAVIAGVGYKTLFRLSFEKRLGFLWTTTNKETSRTPGHRHRDGDGRVPLASASLEFIGQTRYVRGEHATLPAIPNVYRDAFRFLREDAMQLPDSPEDALDTHLSFTTVDSVGTLLASQPTDEDPGYLDFDDPDPEKLAAVKNAVDADREPKFRFLKIL